ncbi:MAG: endonuclease domain-containing protein [Gallionellaceae bacterium]|nr:endonuclease domain-containing protein [Gallionellaceae bacterium]
MKGQTNQHILANKLQRKLRKTMTDAEKKLWQQLRGKQFDGYKFRRQHPFDDFILDFVCLEAKLVVEVDGGQHFESSRDKTRDGVLTQAGFRVVRFWNNQVLNEMESVVEFIWLELKRPNPSPS